MVNFYLFLRIESKYSGKNLKFSGYLWTVFPDDYGSNQITYYLDDTYRIMNTSKNPDIQFVSTPPHYSLCTFVLLLNPNAT